MYAKRKACFSKHKALRIHLLHSQTSNTCIFFVHFRIDSSKPSLIQRSVMEKKVGDVRNNVGHAEESVDFRDE